MEGCGCLGKHLFVYLSRFHFPIMLQIALGIVIIAIKGTGNRVFVLTELWILAARLRGRGFDKGIIPILFNELTLEGRILHKKDTVLFDF